MKLTGLEVVERLQLCLQVGTLMKMRCSSTCFDDPNTHKQDIKDLFTVSLSPPTPSQVMNLAYTHAAATAFSLLLAQTLSKPTCVHKDEVC